MSERFNVEGGYLAVGPNGQLVTLPSASPLKDGWRHATQADLERKAKEEAERKAKEEPAVDAKPKK